MRAFKSSPTLVLLICLLVSKLSPTTAVHTRAPRGTRGGGVAGGSPRLQWKHVLGSSRSTTLESVDVEASAVGAGLCSYRQPPPLLPRAAICFIFFPCVFSRSRYPRPKSPRAPSAGRQNGTVESPRHWDTLTDKGRAELPLRAHTGRVLLTPRCVRRGHFEDKIRSTTYLKESERERSGFGSALNVFFVGTRTRALAPPGGLFRTREQGVHSVLFRSVLPIYRILSLALSAFMLRPYLFCEVFRGSW